MAASLPRSASQQAIDPALMAARKRLTGLEERMPWQMVRGMPCVKKAWAQRRASWVDEVQNTLDVPTLAQKLLLFESMLTQQTLSTGWSANAGAQKLAWRARCAECTEAADLDAAVGDLHGAIMWSRILVTPDGRPLTEEEIASGAYGIGGSSTPLPPPLPVGVEPGDAAAVAAAPAEPPDGLPRGASRMMLLLQAMGVSDYDPKVAVQLLEFSHAWTAGCLNEAAQNSRVRALGLTGPARQQLATQPEPPIEVSDLELAVKSRAASHFVQRKSVEELMRWAAEVNSQPMPLLPRDPSVVQLPKDLRDIEPGARALVARGLDIHESDESDDDVAAAKAELEILYAGPRGVQLPTQAMKREHDLLSLGTGVGPCSSARGGLSATSGVGGVGVAGGLGAAQAHEPKKLRQ